MKMSRHQNVNGNMNVYNGDRFGKTNKMDITEHVAIKPIDVHLNASLPNVQPIVYANVSDVMS